MIYNKSIIDNNNRLINRISKYNKRNIIMNRIVSYRKG